MLATSPEDRPHLSTGVESGTAWEVFSAFLKLGFTAFGGPIAHLGYFRTELVQRRCWLGEATYADLVALCQFMPGPTSSQVGFSLGLLRGGPWGGLAAWSGFTLPSAIAMMLFAAMAGTVTGRVGTGLIHGLKLVTVAVVAQAVWGMAKTLTPDRPRAAIALAAVLIVTFSAGSPAQILAILIGGCMGLALCRGPSSTSKDDWPSPIGRATGVACLMLFALLLFGLPLMGCFTGGGALTLFAAFFRSGALVFGGGHVVLPLLQDAVVKPGWIAPDRFLAGYGIVQAMPGPLFTLSAYLGMVMRPWPNGLPGALIALVAIFLPGLLLVAGALPFWNALRRRPAAQAALRGTNAAVVGILAAALYDPVWTGAIANPRDFAMALLGFLLLTRWQVPPWVVVPLLAVSGIVLASIHA